MRRRTEARVDEGSRSEVLLRRARRHERRGQARKAVIAARQACYEEQTDPRLWALYGAYCWKAGRLEEACDAIRQAIWYRQRARDARRAAALKKLLDKLTQGILPSAA
jgi:Flp pilus assembly protein TadD